MRWLSVGVLLLILGCGVAPGLAEKYIERFSKKPWATYPGGRYKASTNAGLTATTIAGNLVELKPGGMRELHWHDAAEWAYVVEGACQATAIDESKIHPADTWNFTAGDVWYFPANVPHVVLGLAPVGCTFVTGFNNATFDEERSLSASGWLATVPDKTLAQALGIPLSKAQKVLQDARRTNNRPSFMPKGDLKQLLAKPSLPVQFPKLIHRFPLTQNTPEVTHGDGSFINMVDVTRFPVATDMSGALVRIAPGGMRQMHWHLNFDEWQFIINGTLEAGVFNGPGDAAVGVIGAGDLGFAPRGSGHYLRNVGKEMAYVVLIFNAGQFTNVDVNNFMGAVPPAFAAASLNTDLQTAEGIDYKLSGFAPTQDAAAQKKQPASPAASATKKPAAAVTSKPSAFAAKPGPAIQREDGARAAAAKRAVLLKSSAGA